MIKISQKSGLFLSILFLTGYVLNSNAQTFSSYHFCSSGFPNSPWTCRGQNPTSADYQDIGIVTAVAAHPSNPQIIYAGCGRAAGLWKTTDGGTNWVNKTDVLGAASLGIWSIAIHPTNPNLILAGTCTQWYDLEFYEQGMGVLKSIDGGNTWQVTNIDTFPVPYKNIKVIRFHPTDPNIVLAAGNRFIYKSTNAGTTWSIVCTNPYPDGIVHSSGPSFIDIEFLPNNPNIVLASTDCKGSSTDTGAYLFLSTNAGSSWSNVTPSDAFRNSTRYKYMATAISIDVTPADQNNFYIMYQNDCIQNPNNLKDTNDKIVKLCIKKSTNGTIWTQIAQFNSSDVTSNAAAWSGRDKYEFEVSNSDINTFYAGGGIMHRGIYANGGVAWNQISDYHPGTEPLNRVPPHTTHADIRSLIQLPSTPSGDYLLMGNDGGVAKTTDGGSTWWDINGNGLIISEYYAVGTFNSNDNLVGGLQDNGNKLYNSNTNIWSHEKPIYGDGGWMEVDYANESIVYATENSGIYISTDGGKSYKYLFSRSGGKLWDRFHLDPTDHNKLWVPINATNTLRIYNAATDSYIDKYTFTTTDQKITAIDVAPSDGQIVYVAMDGWVGNWAPLGSKLFKSIDGGKTFTDISAGCSAYYWSYINDFCIDPNNSNRIWAGCGPYREYPPSSGKGEYRVIYSSNGGTSWTDISAGLPPFAVNHLVYRNCTDDEIYAGTDAGVYKWNTGSQKWECFNNGFPPIKVTKLEINYRKGTITAATFGRGIWEAPMPNINDEVVNITQTWNTNKTLCGNVVIPSGVTLTITANVFMNPFHKITIQNGGKLILSGGTIDGGKIIAQSGSNMTISNNGKVLLGSYDDLEIQLGAEFDLYEGGVNLK